MLAWLETLNSTTVAIAVIGFLGTVVGTYFSYVSSKKKAGIDIQGSLNSGFQILFDLQQKSLNDLRSVIDEKGAEIDELNERIDALEAMLRENNLPIPRRKFSLSS